MFCVASVIKFSVFSELLLKSTLFVRYKLNRFQPSRVNQFDVRALLFGDYTRFILLDKMVLYDQWKPALWQFIDVTIIFGIVYVV